MEFQILSPRPTNPLRLKVLAAFQHLNFQYRRDAEEFHKNVTDRFGKFVSELAEEKTRLMRFGRFVGWTERSPERNRTRLTS